MAQMNFADCLRDKSLTVKQKTELLSRWLLANVDQVDRLVAFAAKTTDVTKATCLQAFEYATRVDQEVGSQACFDLAASALGEPAPRVKWEAAKVVGNIARSHPKRLRKAIDNLLANATHDGTVVRWSAAFAIGECIKLASSHNARLVPAAEALCARERDNAVRNHYVRALKTVAKAGSTKPRATRPKPADAAGSKQRIPRSSKPTRGDK